MKLKSKINLEAAFEVLKDGLIESEQKWHNKNDIHRQATGMGTIQGTVKGILNHCTVEGCPDLTQYQPKEEPTESIYPTLARYENETKDDLPENTFHSPNI